MPQHRVTMIFGPTTGPTNVIAGGGVTIGTTGAQYGWTESWYRNINETDAQCFAWADWLRICRRALLTPGWMIRGIRLSVFPSSRTSSRRTYAPVDGWGLLSGGLAVGATDEQPYDTLVHAVASQSGHSRQWGARGIGPNVVSAAGVYLAPAAYTDVLTIFNNLMVGNPAALAPGGACLRITTPAPPTYLAGVAIGGVVNGWTATPSSPVLTLLAPDIVVRAGSVIRISGVLGLAGLNGQWTVSQISGVGIANFVQLAPKRGRTVVGLYVSGGYYRTQNYSLDPIISITASQGGSRRTGGSSGRPRGRRSRRQP